MEPVLAYRFYIRILNGKKNTVLRAQSVSGLSVDIKLDDFDTLGGQKKMPASVNFPNLVLKRAILEKGESMGNNAMEMLNNLKVDRMDLGIHLLNAQGKYTRSWNVIGAYTIKWDMSELSVTSKEVVMETVEFKYKYLREIK
ncbi:MAG: phage tail protein [Flavobacteriales bacterium]|nr:phage tail protein [Flavobacteriales bacterium]